MVNVKKSSVVPPSLISESEKPNGTYRTEETLRQIQSDFNNKCYVCEDCNLNNINIEHFIPHRGIRDLYYDWNNLFYCCFHCNNTKGDKAIYDNILNCTDSSQNVLSLLKLSMKPFPFELVTVEAMSDDEATKNTAALLQESYNGSTPLKLLESENLRKKILNEIITFQSLLLNYYEVTNLPIHVEHLTDQIRRKLSEKTMFTAFKVWIVKSNPKFLAAFGEFIPTPIP